MIDQIFLSAYAADKPRIESSDELHDALAGSLPREIHELWDLAGLGKHRSGMLELIDPRIYLSAYSAFFGGDAVRRVPFLLNGFGEPIAYKRINGQEAEISILHTYGPKLEVLAHNLGDFFDRILLTDDGLRQVINVQLFEEVRSRNGRLRSGEVYGFDPRVLENQPVQTKADASYFSKVDAIEQLELLLERAD